MTYEIPEVWSVGQMEDYVFERSATIEALATPPAEALAELPPAERAEEERKAAAWAKVLPGWLSFAEELSAETKARRSAEREALVRRGRVRAADARWESALSALATQAQGASGNNPKLPPYRDFFGSVTVQEAKSLGATNASRFGRTLAAKACETDVQFQPAARRLNVYSGVLEIVGDARDDLAIVNAQAEARRIKLHSKLEDLVAATASEIAEFIPRTEVKELSRMLLSPTEARPGKPRKAQAEQTA